MGEVVGLGRVRKARARADRAAQAAANRLSHGRTGAQKAAERETAERAQRLLDGARRED